LHSYWFDYQEVQ